MEILAKLILLVLLSPILLIFCTAIASKSRPLAAFVAVTGALGMAALFSH